MRRLWLLLGICLVPSVAFAQTPVAGTEKIGWDQVAASLPAASAFVYTLYIDNTPTTLASVTCAGTASPFACAAPLPAMTPARHDLQLTAAEVVNGTQLESLRSTTFPVVLRV